MEFTHIQNTNKEERIRAWAVEQAIESYSGEEVYSEGIVQRASLIEKYIREGKQD